MPRRVAASGRLIVTDVGHAKIAIGLCAVEGVEPVPAEAGVAVVPLPRPPLPRASKAFREYRRRGRTRTGVPPDFLIGAHAEASRLPLLTRDAARCLTHLPDLRPITPSPLPPIAPAG